MCRRDHRYWLFGDIDIKLLAALVNSGKMRLDKSPALMADIQEYTVYPESFHLVVDRPGDNISRRQFAALIKTMHESLTIGQA
ncbi:hypothetical protein MnTg03_01163 [bacterium MnTg03]|nr:hypothetical protein MnTg03_01163 [bacterium MnTg03]